MIFSKKSILAILMAQVVMISIFASACGSKNETTSSASSTSAASTEEAVATIAPAEPVTIVYESWGPSKAILDQILEGFKKARPEITVETKLHANFTEFVTALKTAVAAGDSPDVFGFDSATSLSQLKYQIEPLDALMVKKYGDSWKDQYLPGPLSDVTSDGILMGVPGTISPAGLIWYNKTIFDKYGIQEPKTYDELKAAADILVKNKVSPMFLGTKDSWCTIDHFQTILNDVAPGKQYDAFAKKIKFTDSDIVKAFDVWKKFFDDKIFQNDSFSMTQYMDSYNAYVKDQKGAMWSNGAWSLDIYSNKDLKSVVDATEWGVMAMPDLNGDGKSAPLLSSSGGTCISKDSDNKDAAFAYLDFISLGDGAIPLINEALATASTVKKVEPTVEMTANQKKNHTTIMELSQSLGMVHRGIDNAKVAEKIYEVLTKVAYGQMTSQAAAEEVQKVIDAN